MVVFVAAVCLVLHDALMLCFVYAAHMCPQAGGGRSPQAGASGRRVPSGDAPGARIHTVSGGWVGPLHVHIVVCIKLASYE